MKPILAHCTLHSWRMSQISGHSHRDKELASWHPARNCWSNKSGMMHISFFTSPHMLSPGYRGSSDSLEQSLKRPRQLGRAPERWPLHRPRWAHQQVEYPLKELSQKILQFLSSFLHKKMKKEPFWVYKLFIACKIKGKVTKLDKYARNICTCPLARNILKVTLYFTINRSRFVRQVVPNNLHNEVVVWKPAQRAIWPSGKSPLDHKV